MIFYFYYTVYLIDLESWKGGKRRKKAIFFYTKALSISFYKTYRNPTFQL